MATEYKVFKGKDGRVVVVLHSACKITRDEILALLADAGVDLAIVTFVEPEDIVECGDLSGVSVIIPLDDAICDQPELEGIGRQCGTTGARVVVIFGPSCSFEGLHPIAEKYGTQCDWSADSVKDCVGGVIDAPRDPAGKTAERQRAREVVCRK